AQSLNYFMPTILKYKLQRINGLLFSPVAIPSTLGPPNSRHCIKPYHSKTYLLQIGISKLLYLCRIVEPLSVAKKIFNQPGRDS
ncbi:MAG: hypothetical protein WCM93_14135, partial [Bacteroidota bacterium]